MNTLTKTPSTTWFDRSRMKFLSMRGVNWLDARERATIVIENVTPATVIIEPAIVDSILRAPSALDPIKAGHSINA